MHCRKIFYIFFFLLVKCEAIYKNNVKLATKQQYILPVNNCTSPTCSFVVQPSQLSKEEYLEVFFVRLNVSGSLPECRDRAVEVSIKFGQSYKKITNLCSKNLISSISNKRFISRNGSIKLTYKGHQDSEGFTISYQIKQFLTSEQCSKSDTHIVSQMTASHDPSLNRNSMTCNTHIEVPETNGIKLFFMKPTDYESCLLQEGAIVITEYHNNTKVADSCINEIEDWCGLDLPIDISTGNGNQIEVVSPSEEHAFGYVTYSKEEFDNNYCEVTEKELEVVNKKVLYLSRRRYIDTTRIRYSNTTRRRYIDTTRRRYIDTRRRYIDATRRRYIDTTRRRYIDATRRRYIDTTRRRYIDTTRRRYRVTTRSSAIVCNACIGVTTIGLVLSYIVGRL